MAETPRGVYGGGEEGRRLADEVLWRRERGKSQQPQQRSHQQHHPQHLHRPPPPPPPPQVSPPQQQQQPCCRHGCIDYQKGDTSLPREGVRRGERGVTWYDHLSGRPRAPSEGDCQERKLSNTFEEIRAYQEFKLKNEFEGEERGLSNECEGEGGYQAPKLSNEFGLEGVVGYRERKLSNDFGEGQGGYQGRKPSHELQGEERKLSHEFGGEGGYGGWERSHRPEGERVEERRGTRGVIFRPPQTDVSSCTRSACLSPSAGMTVPDDLKEAADVHWLNSLDGEACLLVDSYRDLADGVALEEAFCMVEGLFAAPQSSRSPAGRIRNSLTAAVGSQGRSAVPPRLLQPEFAEQVCDGEPIACGDLIAFLKCRHSDRLVSGGIKPAAPPPPIQKPKYVCHARLSQEGDTTVAHTRCGGAGGGGKGVIGEGGKEGTGEGGRGGSAEDGNLAAAARTNSAPVLPHPKLQPPSILPAGGENKLEPRCLSTCPVAHEPGGARPVARDALHGVATLAAADRRRKHKADREHDTEPGPARPAPLTKLRRVVPLAAADRRRKSEAVREPDSTKRKQQKAPKRETCPLKGRYTAHVSSLSSRRDAAATAVSLKKAEVTTATAQSTTAAVSQGSRRTSVVEHGGNCCGTEQRGASRANDTSTESKAPLRTRKISGSPQRCESAGGRGRGRRTVPSDATAAAAVQINIRAPGRFVASALPHSNSAPRSRSKSRLAGAHPRSNSASRGRSEGRLAPAQTLNIRAPRGLSEGRLAPASPPLSNSAPLALTKGRLLVAPPPNSKASRGRSEGCLASAQPLNYNAPRRPREGRLAPAPPPSNNRAPRGCSGGKSVAPRTASADAAAADIPINNQTSAGLVSKAPPPTISALRGRREVRLASAPPPINSSAQHGMSEGRLASSGAATAAMPKNNRAPARLIPAPLPGHSTSRDADKGRMQSAPPSLDNGDPHDRNGGAIAASLRVTSTDSVIRGAGRRRAERREILRWMGRLGVKVAWSLLTPEEGRCHERLSSGVLLCELAAAIDYSVSGGRGLPLSEVQSCPGRFVLRGTCGAPTNAARSRHNVRAALGAFRALGGLVGTWLRSDEAILQGDHGAVWGLLSDLYAYYGRLRPRRVRHRQPRNPPTEIKEAPPPPPPPPPPPLAKIPTGSTSATLDRRNPMGVSSSGITTTVHDTRSGGKPLAEPNQNLLCTPANTVGSSPPATPPPQNTVPSRGVVVAPPTGEVATARDLTNDLTSQSADEAVRARTKSGEIQRWGRGRNAGASSGGKVDRCSAANRKTSSKLALGARVVSTLGSMPPTDQARQKSLLPNRKPKSELTPRARVAVAFGNAQPADPARKESLLPESPASIPAKAAPSQAATAAAGGEETDRWLQWNPVEKLQDHTWGRPTPTGSASCVAVAGHGRPLGKTSCVAGQGAPPTANVIPPVHRMQQPPTTQREGCEGAPSARAPPIHCRQPPLPEQHAGGANGGQSRGAAADAPLNDNSGRQTSAQRPHDHGAPPTTVVPPINCVQRPPPTTAQRARSENVRHSRRAGGLHADIGGRASTDVLSFGTRPGERGSEHGVHLSLGGLPPCIHTPCIAPVDPFCKSAAFDILPNAHHHVDISPGLVC